MERLPLRSRCHNVGRVLESRARPDWPQAVWEEAMALLRTGPVPTGFPQIELLVIECVAVPA